MALKHTLLGLLILHPRTGYDLYKRIEQATFLLESATLRRIYPTLKRMTVEGLVVFEVEPQEGKPDRKIYSVTEKGQAAFLDWLRDPPGQDDFTLNKLFARFFFYGMLDKETLIQHLRNTHVERQEMLTRLKNAEVDPPLGPCRPFVDTDRVTAVWRMMLDYGRAELHTQTQWLEDTIALIEDEFQD